MGGAAFARAAAEGHPTLSTPRMTPEQYAKLKSIYIEKLQKLFPTGEVACLLEAPEKTSYGDLDIFVAIDQRVNFGDFANCLNAAGVICHSSGQVQKCSIAVPIDGGPNSKPAVVYKHVNDNSGRKTQPSATMTEEAFAQIDIEIVEREVLGWHRFYSSYGDLAGLLGHSLHNLGFTVTDRGFWLRHPKLDWSKGKHGACVNIADKDGRILLSDDPKKVMEFLGLSVQVYEEGFITVNALYAWLEKCRLISPHAIKWKREKADVKRRELTRSLFSTFFNEYLPEHDFKEQFAALDIGDDEPSSELKEAVHTLRAKHLEEAIEFFEKQAEYEKMHNYLIVYIDNATAVELLKPILTEFSGKEGKNLNEITRAFRRHVAFDIDGQPYVLDTPHSDAESQLHCCLAEDRESFKDPEGMREWVGKHWEELKALERQRTKGFSCGTSDVQS